MGGGAHESWTMTIKLQVTAPRDLICAQNTNLTTVKNFRRGITNASQKQKPKRSVLFQQHTSDQDLIIKKRSPQILYCNSVVLLLMNADQDPRKQPPTTAQAAQINRQLANFATQT